MPQEHPKPADRLDGLAVGVMLLLCAVWGVQQVASKVALSQGMPPQLQALLRSVVAAPLLLAWFAARQGRPGLARLAVPDGTLRPGLLTAVLFAMEFILLFRGVQLTNASHAVVLLFSGGLFTAVGTHLLVPNERLGRVQAAGLVLAFLGVVATVGGAGQGESSWLGDAYVLGAAACWGLTTVVVKANPAMAQAPAEKVLGYQLFGSIPLLLAAAWAWDALHVPTASALAWASVAFQCVAVAFASYLTWFWLVSRYPAGRLAVFSFLTPLLGVVAAWVLLHEPLTPMLLVGLVCVGLGLHLTNRA